MSGCVIGHTGSLGLGVGHRDQWEAQVTHFAEQAVQRGLVDHRAMEDGGAVALVGEAQPVKPGGSASIEVPLEADCVTSGLVTVVNGYVSFTHGAPSCVGLITQ